MSSATVVREVETEKADPANLFHLTLEKRYLENPALVLSNLEEPLTFFEHGDISTQTEKPASRNMEDSLLTEGCKVTQHSNAVRAHTGEEILCKCTAAEWR